MTVFTGSEQSYEISPGTLEHRTKYKYNHRKSDNEEKQMEIPLTGQQTVHRNLKGHDYGNY